jgi:hypothetical protein
MRSITTYLFESDQINQIKKYIPEKDLNNIIPALQRLSYLQATEFGPVKDPNLKLYFEPVLYIKGKKQDNLEVKSNDAYFRIYGYIEVKGHQSDVVAFYYPKTGKFTIEENGVNG